MRELLKDRKEMKRLSMFTVDTEKVMHSALEAGCELVNFFYCEGGEALSDVFPAIREKAVKVKKSFIDSHSSVKTHSNFIAVLRHFNEQSDIRAAGIMVVLDTVQDPSNVGAIMRSGAAFGFDDYILIDSAYHLSEKAIRSSAGAVFLCRVSHMNESGAIEALRGRLVLAAESKGGTPLPEAAMKARGKKCALIMGSEGRGVSEGLLRITDIRLKIIHRNEKVESLNVAAAAAVIMNTLSLER